VRFRQQQDEARAATERLLLLFAVLLLGVAAAVNLALAGLYKLVTWGLADYPPLFFETNTAVVLLFVLGGCVVEAWRLRDGGGRHVAAWVGGREITAPRDLAEKRLANVVDEMAIASGLPRPALYVLEREDAINAFVAGWSRDATVLAVTRGALECLTRDELQGLVAHEFGHVHAGDLRLQMRLLALVWGLSLVHGYGRSLIEPDELGRRSLPGVLVGVAFLAAGWVGWLAGRVLQAAVSRQREHAADASAVQFTRSRDGLGGTLRKIWFQSERPRGRLHHPRADMVAAMLLHVPARLSLGGWLATHPPLAERVRRVCGREMAPLPAAPLDLAAAEAAVPMDSAAATRDDARLPATALQAANTMPTTPDNDLPPQFGPDLPDTEPPPGARPAEPEGKAFVPLALQSPTAGQDELDALGRLKFLQGPGERRAALLALLLTPGSAREKQAWREETEGVASAGRVRSDVQLLSFAARAPAFELLLDRSRPAPVPERQALVEAARRVMSADGLVRPIDRLRWLAMRHRLGETRPPRAAAAAAADNDMTNLPLPMVDHIATMTAFLARLVPAAEAAAAVGAAGHAWYQAVMASWAGRYRDAGRDLPPCRPPDADMLMHALWGVQELSWMLRPVLLRAWVDEACAMRETPALREEAADALRLAALLLDAPLPPVLARHYLELKLD
jgi:Zn-dependent protease with chaperone function